MALTALALLGLHGCAGDPAAPLEPADITVVAGVDQQGLAGQPLFRSIVVRVTAADGAGVPGVDLDLRPEAGSADANPTDIQGLTAVRWTLGEDPSVQTLTVAVPGGPQTVVSARAIRPEASDVVVLPPGDIGEGAGAVFVAEAGAFLSPLWEGAADEGRIVLPPQTGEAPPLVVFPRGRPVFWAGPWTVGRDSLVLEPVEPVRLDITVSLHQPPLDALRRTLDAHLARVRELLAAHGTGIVLGEVSVIEAPVDGANVNGPDLCAGEPAGRVLVYYVRSVDGDPGKGYGCGHQIAMGSATGLSPGLLAHELGHLLALRHSGDTGNLMHPGSPGPGMTEGQIFRAHYHVGSVVNTVFGVTPPELRLNCDGVAGVGADACFEETYELPF